MSGRAENKVVIPQWLLDREGITRRQWKSIKRQEMRFLCKYMSRFRNGCAYTPAHRRIEDLEQILNEMQDSLSIKNWGR